MKKKNPVLFGLFYCLATSFGRHVNGSGPHMQKIVGLSKENRSFQFELTDKDILKTTMS